MNKDQMDKYAYELMVKNNPDEAVKNLLLKDKEIERLNNIINELEKWLIYEYSKYNGAIRISNVLDKLKELKEGK